MNQLTLYLVFFLLTAAVTAGQTKTRNPSGIRSIDFRNYTYGSGNGKMRVRNGKWKGAYPGEYFSVDKVLYGDLTGDGKEEAVVIVSNSGGGSGQSSSCLIFTLQNGRAKELSSRDRHGYGPYSGIVGGDRGQGGIFSARIERGLLYVEQYAPGDNPNSPPYQPAYIETITYKWNGSLFVHVGKITRRRFRR